jgi:hypothetical protein
MDRRQLGACSHVVEAVRTDTIAISHVLFFALASAAACDLGKGDDAGFDDGIAESSTSAGYDSADTAPVTTFPPDPSETSTSGGSGCDASHTTDPTTPPDTATSAGETYGDEGVGSATSGSDSGPLPDTEGGTSVGADTDGNACFVPVSPGNFEYGCECEDPTCDIWYSNVEQIPAFEQLCDCLCESKGCGGAVGGVGEAGGEEG